MSIENGSVSTEKAKKFLDTHVKAICKKAELLLSSVLQARISTLSDLCKTTKFEWESFEKVNKLPITDDRIQMNTFLEQCFTQLKPYFRQFIEDTTLLRYWITLLIPKTEDGDNLGVEIQCNIITDCDSYITAVTNMYYKATDFYLERGRMVSKLHKYPDSAKPSVKTAIAEYDEAMFLTIKSYPQKLYYYTVTVYDNIMKNIDKVRKPKNDSHDFYLTC